MTISKFTLAANTTRDLPKPPTIEVLLIGPDGWPCHINKFLRILADDDGNTEYPKQLIMAMFDLLSRLPPGIQEMLSLHKFEPPLAIHGWFQGWAKEVDDDGSPVEGDILAVVDHNYELGSVDLALIYRLSNGDDVYIAPDEFLHNICVAISILILSNRSTHGPHTQTSPLRNYYNYLTTRGQQNTRFLENFARALLEDFGNLPFSYRRRFFPEIRHMTTGMKDYLYQAVLVSNAAHIMATVLNPEDSLARKYAFFFPRALAATKDYLKQLTNPYFSARRFNLNIGGETQYHLTLVGGKNYMP